ncbi:MAG: hypothetical protein GC161_13995 [Planctomycetaceae bacterium]|nr:hypothetical protein [Planctomycetaceae bacterium]
MLDDVLSWPLRALRTIAGWALGLLGWLWALLVDEIFTNVYVVAAAVYGFFRALGVTVRSGFTGQRFTLGRADKRLDPGFHWLIPFVQRAKVVPTRSRTLDLEGQRIATRDGLVVLVSSNLVWRIEDVTKSLVEVDNLVAAMRDWLAVAAARVLSATTRADLNSAGGDGGSAELDRRLEATLGELLAPWGVAIERAGFPTIAPSPRTALILQTRGRVRTRLAAHDTLGGGALGVLLAGGHPELPARRFQRAAPREAASRAARRAAGQLAAALRAGGPGPLPVGHSVVVPERHTGPGGTKAGPKRQRVGSQRNIGPVEKSRPRSERFDR